MWLRSVGHEGSSTIDLVVKLVVNLFSLVLDWRVEGFGCNLLIMESVLSGLVQDSLKTVNKVFVVFVAFKHVERRQDELILLIDESAEDFNVVLVLEVVVSQAVDKLEQLLLVLWNG